MPELPEVETVVRGLNRLIVAKKIAKVQTFNSPRSFPNAESDVKNFIVGAKIKQVRRRAKMILIDLDDDYTLAAHLKMTGQMVYDDSNPADRFGAGHPSDSLVGNLPDRSTRVEFDFTDGSKLFFNDQRKFGWVKLIPTAELQNLKFLQTVGPEPLDDDFTAENFTKRFARKKRSNIKAALLDQTVIAGVGNIYADETLWAAKLHPQTLVQDLTEQDFNNIYRELRRILKLSIAKGGSTNRNYVDAEGKKGNYLNFANVYARVGQPCHRCGHEIIKIRVAGRGTHICPICQQLLSQTDIIKHND